MVYVRRFLIVCFTVLLAGCSTFNKKDTDFEVGYRAGVKENIADFSRSFYGNDFPYFYWSSPIVQSVRVPAHIENGVFVPEHNELVLIEPGEWREKAGYPINCPRKDKELLKKEGGDPYAYNYLNFGVRDITVLPESFACAERRDKNQDTH